MSNKDNTKLSRRKILRGSAVGAFAAFSSPSVVAKQKSKITETEQEEILQDYQDAQTVNQAVHAQSDVLNELVADGVLENPSIDGLEKLTEPTDGVGERLTTYQIGERHTPRIKVFRRVDAGFLSLSVFPEEDTAHAILTPVKDGKPLGEDHLVEYGDMPSAQAEPQGCVAPWECYGCSSCYTYCCEYNTDDECVQTCTDCNCSCSPDYC